METLEIVLSMLVEGGLLPIDKIVIEAEGNGPDAVGHELHGQPFGEGRLP